MSKHPTLLNDVEQFLYNHAPNMMYKKQLLLLVKTWEDAYKARITELELQDSVGNRMESEGAPATPTPVTECECDIVRFPPCSYCAAREYRGGGYDYGGD